MKQNKVIKVILTVGLCMLLVGGFPWIYTPALMHDRPNGEAAGMIGTLIFMFIGLPGLVITVVAACLLIGQRQR